VRLTDAVQFNAYARRRVTEEDIYTWPPSAFVMDMPRVGEWIVTSRDLVERWTLPGVPPPTMAEMGFWHANSRMLHKRNLQASEWRLVHRREDWEPWEFYRYVVIFDYYGRDPRRRDPRDFIVYDRDLDPRTGKPPWW
jgi:hypothetical protein